MSKITALNGQTLIDLAIQEGGSVEAAFSLANNNGLSVTDDLIPGEELEPVDAVEKPIADYYKSKKLKPATDDLTDTNDVPARIFAEELPIEFA